VGLSYGSDAASPLVRAPSGSKRGRAVVVPTAMPCRALSALVPWLLAAAILVGSPPALPLQDDDLLAAGHAADRLYLSSSAPSGRPPFLAARMPGHAARVERSSVLRAPAAASAPARPFAAFFAREKRPRAGRLAADPPSPD
jgi:hypothetical protein